MTKTRLHEYFDGCRTSYGTFEPNVAADLIKLDQIDGMTIDQIVDILTEFNYLTYPWTKFDDTLSFNLMAAIELRKLRRSVGTSRELTDVKNLMRSISHTDDILLGFMECGFIDVLCKTNILNIMPMRKVTELNNVMKITIFVESKSELISPHALRQLWRFWQCVVDVNPPFQSGIEILKKLKTKVNVRCKLSTKSPFCDIDVLVNQ